MFERCISLHCFGNGKILGLEVEIRADLLETVLTLQKREKRSTYVQKSLDLNKLFQKISKQHQIIKKDKHEIENSCVFTYVH